MAWIKTHPHLLFLILVAVAVLAASGFVVKSAMDFDQKFDVVRQSVTKKTQVYVQSQEPIEQATAEFQKPAQWSVPPKAYSPFVCIPLMMVKDEVTGKESLGEPTTGNNQTQSRTKEGIPNQWFFDHQLSPFKTGVNREDSDLDGFPNEEEWTYKTDPRNKDSHPPYYTRLFFVKYIKVPFLLRFQSINGEPEKDKPDTLEFQINTITLGKGSVFLKLGDMVPKTKFKIDKFEFKMGQTKNGTEVNVSELTLTNTETGVPVILIYNTTTDSPDSYAHFHYLWPDLKKPIDISVKKSKDFSLKPESDVLYKLLDIDDTKAVIQLPSGEKLDIFPAPAGYP